MPFTCQALPCFKHSSPVERQHMQGGSPAKEILNFELFCGLSWGTSISSFSNLKGPANDTSLSQGTLMWDGYQSPLQNQPLLKASSQGFGRCYYLSFNPECLWCLCNMLLNEIFYKWPCSGLLQKEDFFASWTKTWNETPLCLSNLKVMNKTKL